MSKQSLLLVDGDTRSLRVLEVSLRKAGFTVTAAASVQDALDKLELHTPDLIISETTFTDGDGFELRRRVRATPDWAEIPFVFLTAEAAIENKIRGLELGVDDYLTKPIYIKEIVTRINILLQKRQRVRFEERKDGRTRFAGRVADMPVVDVIQTIEISRKSGVIQFVGERGRQAAIYFRDGKVIDAEAGTLQGEDAVYRLLTWSDGEFEVVFRTVRRREVITMSSQGLLMEGMRRLDEWSRLLEQLPPLSHRFEIDPGELATRLAEIPDDNNKILRLFDGKRTLLEVIDASDFGDLECLQAIAKLFFEEILLDLDHGQPAKRVTGKPMPLVELEVDQAAPLDDARESGSIEASHRDTQPIDEHEIVSDEPARDPLLDEPLEPPPEDHPGALHGSYRPSSLRLIDEAVAAAQAIEPSLFEDSNGPPRAVNGTPHAMESVPVAITEDVPKPSPPPRAREPEPEPEPAFVHRPGREESGLRMIGSLGRDRAEASGELATPGEATPPIKETQRELVTILPRRITREMAVVPPSAEAAKEPAPAAPVEQPSTPMLRPKTPSSQPPRTAEGTGVVSSGGGPGAGAIALIILAAVLAGLAVFLLIDRSGKAKQAAVPADAATMLVVLEDAGVEDASSAPTADAYQVALGPVDAGRRADAATVARVDAATADGVQDPMQRARILYQQATEAIQEGDFAKALELTDASLVLRKTARGFLVRAQALHRLGRVDEALQATVSAEKLAPTYATVYEVRGNILWAQRRWDDAHDAYNRFLEIEQDTARAETIRKRLEENH